MTPPRGFECCTNCRYCSPLCTDGIRGRRCCGGKGQSSGDDRSRSRARSGSAGLTNPHRLAKSLGLRHAVIRAAQQADKAKEVELSQVCSVPATSESDDKTPPNTSEPCASAAMPESKTASSESDASHDAAEIQTNASELEQHEPPEAAVYSVESTPPDSAGLDSVIGVDDNAPSSGSLSQDGGVLSNSSHEEPTRSRPYSDTASSQDSLSYYDNHILDSSLEYSTLAVDQSVVDDVLSDVLSAANLSDSEAPGELFSGRRRSDSEGKE